MRQSGRTKRARASGRLGGKLELLLGRHSVREALLAGRRELGTLLLRRGAQPGALEELVRLARERGLPSREVDGDELSRGLAANDRVPAVALEAGPLPEVEIATLLAADAGGRRLVALDGVEDPQNLGAIARVAEASGCDGLILQQRRGPPLSPAASRASAGALEWLPAARVGNLPRTLEQLKSEGFWVVGADLAGPPLFEIPDRILAGDLVVVLGAEGKGLRPGVRELVDHALRIPMVGRVDSLNVATAAAVILFDLLRRSSPAAPESGAPEG